MSAQTALRDIEMVAEGATGPNGWAGQPAVPRLPGLVGTFMGRDALTLAGILAGLRHEDAVLLPAYTCQDTLKALGSSHNVVFYDIRPDLVIDPDEIRAKLAGRNTRLVLITDYFGFLQPYRREIKAICAAAGAGLIEDCAHSLLTEGAGETGDFAVYSLRKILPLTDGGGLKLNRPANAMAPEFYPRIYSDVLSVLASVKNALHLRGAGLSRASVASRTAALTSTPASSQQERRILPLSRVARRRLDSFSFLEVVRRRREDYQFWSEVTAATPSMEPVFRDLPAGVCPFGFAVKVKERNALESRARRAGISLQVHWRLDAGVVPGCRVSHQLSGEMLTLPLYPEITRETRQRLAQVLANGR